MRTSIRCDRCGSAGCVEFGMCQVCYRDYSHLDGLVEEPLCSPRPELGRDDESIFRGSMDYGAMDSVDDMDSEDVEDALAGGARAA